MRPQGLAGPNVEDPNLDKEGHCSCSRLSPVFSIDIGPGLHTLMT